MSKPLKDIIAELEAKHGHGGLASLEERALIIREYDTSIDFLLRQMDNYVHQVNYTIEHKLSLTIISRITQNLIFQIAYSHDLLVRYSYIIGVGLMDERYDENYRYWKEFDEKGDKIVELIERLYENNIFNTYDIASDESLKYLHIKIGFDDKIPSQVEQEMHLAYSNSEKLLTCLKYMLDTMSEELESTKMTDYFRDNDILKENYEINYLLYATEYWPKHMGNFRSHITKQILGGNVTIAELGKIRRDQIHEFESTEVGKIWRDNSEDIPQMARQMRNQKINEAQWKYFFQTIFEIEELERWMDELRNPPESEADKQKRQRLLKSNRIFNLKPAKQNKEVDILLLYQFIETRFITEKMFKYEWYALFYTLKRNGIVTTCTIEDFASQMNDKEWFAHVECECKANEVNTYHFLDNKAPDAWTRVEIPSGNRATKKSLRNLYLKYDELANTIDEIFICR